MNRFRRAGPQIADVLADCRVQIYSLAEPVDPQPPEHYDLARAYTASIIQVLKILIEVRILNSQSFHSFAI